MLAHLTAGISGTVGRSRLLLVYHTAISLLAGKPCSSSRLCARTRDFGTSKSSPVVSFVLHFFYAPRQLIATYPDETECLGWLTDSAGHSPYGPEMGSRLMEFLAILFTETDLSRPLRRPSSNGKLLNDHCFGRLGSISHRGDNIGRRLMASKNCCKQPCKPWSVLYTYK